MVGCTAAKSILDDVCYGSPMDPAVSSAIATTPGAGEKLGHLRSLAAAGTIDWTTILQVVGVIVQSILPLLKGGPNAS